MKHAKPPPAPKEAREAKLAQALRANLRRRKEKPAKPETGTRDD